MPQKRILLFAAKLGYQTRSFEEAAKKLDVELVYVTDRCHQLEDPWNDRAIAVKFESPEVAAHTVIQHFREIQVDGILALGDRPMAAAAYAARGLGIAHNHPLSIEACRSKLRMREVFRDAGLRTPWFRKIPLHPAPEPALLGITYPCVLKPLSLSASQGVIRANNRVEFLAAVARIRNLLASAELQASREPNLNHLIVEGYIPGEEVAVEGVLANGTLRILASFDKPDPLVGPYFEETIYVTPSRRSLEMQQEIERTLRDSVAAIGLTYGPVHAEFRINEDGVWPLEIAPRPIGGLCARALRFGPNSTGEWIGLEELLLRHAAELGETGLARESQSAGVMMIPVPRSGIYEGVAGLKAAKEVVGITDILITAREHDAIAAWPEGSSYLGFIFARAEKPQEVESALREAHAKLQFQIVPTLPVEHPVTGKIKTAG
ncbi:MAG: ATP-grasp domain-containing protein [Acidobacteria bacterium]|nr:ATP-grasp domain-containing protein [Acidobacteriota bacterium]MBS1865872.1 ATP-grasp domain-containing protein [Acidobacteriota bacterium]